MIPDYQTLMLPLLRLTEDGREHRLEDVRDPLAKQFGLTEEELLQLLPSGRQTVLNNRVHWAKTYLSQAGLLEITRRAHFRITDRGREVLRQKLEKIDVRVLERFPEFKEFKQRARESQVGGTEKQAMTEPHERQEPVSAGWATPDEVLRSTVADIDAALSAELLQRILILLCHKFLRCERAGIVL